MMKVKKNIVILGSTGSIGVQALEVIENNRELFNVIALAAGNNIELLEKQIRKFKPEIVSVANQTLAKKLAHQLADNTRILFGSVGLNELASLERADFIINALVGSIGLLPTISAIKAHKTIGLANKETLIAGGQLVMDLVKKNNVTLLPIDSEHSAIFQALNGEKIENVDKIILTASGGSFRDKTREDLVDVAITDALNHPNWEMGAKITIDSATMVNKGLEVIEAHWLFGISYEQIEVLIHPESIIHSMVQYLDKSVIAQLSNPDMRLPIQYALTYPERINLNIEEIDFVACSKLTFKEPCYSRFPALKLAYQSGLAGGTAPTVFNAANEVAVAGFLEQKIPFLAIEDIIAGVLDQHHNISTVPNLEEIMGADKWARTRADILINK